MENKTKKIIILVVVIAIIAVIAGVFIATNHEVSITNVKLGENAQGTADTSGNLEIKWEIKGNVNGLANDDKVKVKLYDNKGNILGETELSGSDINSQKESTKTIATIPVSYTNSELENINLDSVDITVYSMINTEIFSKEFKLF